MTSPQPTEGSSSTQQDNGESSSSSIPPVIGTQQQNTKPIHSFFAGPSASGSTSQASTSVVTASGSSTSSNLMASTASSSNTNPVTSGNPKKRRKKDGDQAQLALSMNNRATENGGGGVWVMARPAPVPQTDMDAETSAIPVLEGALAATTGKTKKTENGIRAKGGLGGEEEELKEMSMKSGTKENGAVKSKGKGRGKRKSGIGIEEAIDQPRQGPRSDLDLDDLIDPSLLGPQSNPATQPPSSPAKNRGRPRKVQKTNPVNSQPSSSPVVPSVDLDSISDTSPSRPVRHNATHRQSNDFEITSTSLVAPRPTPGHPFFSRSDTANSQKGAHARDAIEIDERSPDRPAKSASQPQSQVRTDLTSASSSAPGPVPAVGPRKIAFVADAKPAHSFFTRVTAPDASVRDTSRASSVASGLTETNGTIPMERVPSTGAGAGHGDRRGNINLIVKTKGKEKKEKVHSFFKVSTQASEWKLKDGWGKDTKDGEGWVTPLPGGEWPNHIGSESRSTSQPTKGVLSGRARRVPPKATSDSFWSSFLTSTSKSPEHTPHAPHEGLAVPFYIAQHPAFSSLASKHTSSSSNRESWSDKYRPQSAEQVLSNEIEATYLQDWLSTLSVGHGHRDSLSGSRPEGRKVVRKVQKGKLKSSLLDGWIVDDLGLFGDPPVEAAEEEEPIELEDLDEPEITPDPDAARPNAYPSLESRLTNTILLTGPHGSGKSAAVHAVAHELGWDVFEVFPGMGKRTGGNIMSWVGDVGRNHMVAQAQGHGPGHHYTPAHIGKMLKEEDKKAKEKEKDKKGGLKSFFGKPATATVTKALSKANSTSKDKFEFGSQGSAAEPIDIDDENEIQVGGKARKTHQVIDIDSDENNDNDEDASKIGGAESDVAHINTGGLAAAGSTGNDGTIRQSLILLDEADILFDEESTFWPAVISLIADSRRPVILTCNDHTRIPKDQLPLQAILQFRPTPSYIAIPYLRAIAQQEAVKPSNADRITSATVSHPADVQHVSKKSFNQKEEGDGLIDQPLPPNGNERIPYFDLRRALTQLQLDRGGGTIDEAELGGHASNGEDQRSHDGKAEGVEDELRNLARRFENVSFADAFIDLRLHARMELSEIDRHAPTTDDELGPHLLCKPVIDEGYPVHAGADISFEVGATLLGLVGGKLELQGDLSWDRAKYIRSTLPLLDAVIPLGSPLLPHSSLFLYTLPTITRIIETDDTLQIAEEEAVRRGEERVNRKTGRPVRGGAGYVRWFEEIGDEAEEVGRGLGWGV